MISRNIESKILNDFGKKKVIVLLGARQVGKTTLLEMLQSSSQKTLRLNCDDYDDILLLENKSSTELKSLLTPYDIVYIDEAQRISDIGLTIKKIGDLKLDTQVVVTGSSSLDLANNINEPATGRTIEYKLYPLSLQEMSEDTTEREEQRMLHQRLVYGCYPEVVTSPHDSKRILTSLTNSYLYKDILSYKGIKKPEILQKLLQALSLQLGSEVSYNELSNLLGIDKQTVENYIGLLEKCFVIFRLDSFSRNLRNEIKKGKKVYFYDNGVRNAVISNYAPVELRNDVGALWENLMVSERVKRNAYNNSYARLYFWRTHDQKEIDLIEEEDGRLSAYEFKWNTTAKARVPQVFMQTYPGTSFSIISPDNYWGFVKG
jgi:predicted AAA+ superfamily ATPase